MRKLTLFGIAALLLAAPAAAGPSKLVVARPSGLLSYVATEMPAPSSSSSASRISTARPTKIGVSRSV